MERVGTGEILKVNAVLWLKSLSLTNNSWCGLVLKLSCEMVGMLVGI